MLFTGDAWTPWHKPMTAAYFCYLIIAVAAYATRAFGARTVAYASLLTAATPRLLLSAFIVHVDPLRLYGFFLPFAFLMEFLRSNSRCWLIASAIGVAIALHVHAGNFLIVPFLSVPYLLLSSEPFWHRLRNAFFVGLFVGAVSGAQYVDNMLHYGSLTPTQYSVEAVPEFHTKEWEVLSRGVGTPLEALINGALAPFSLFDGFGPTPWLGLFGLLILAVGVSARWRKVPEVSLIVLPIARYFALVLLAVAVEMTVFYKNIRYALIVLPFMALAGSVFCVRFVDCSMPA